MKSLPYSVFLIGLPILLLCFPAFSQSPTPPTPAVPTPSAPTGPIPTPSPPPKIEFAETVFDAGETWEGDKAAHIYKFKNTGGSTLLISRVRTSCGCTAALVSQDKVEPGQEGEIKAEFNTRRYRGQQKKIIYVSTNDPDQATVQLELSVTVKAIAALSPQSLNFHEVTWGEQSSQVIQLVPESGYFKITNMTAQPEYFQARILDDKKEVGEDKAPLRIEVTLGPEAPIGRLSGSLVVATDHPQLPRLEAKLFAQVEGLVKYTPRMLLFSQGNQQEKLVKKITVNRQGDKDLTISSVESTIPQLQAELNTVSTGKEFEISVQLKPGQTPGRYRGFIVIRTDQKGQEEIKIPVTADIH